MKRKLNKNDRELLINLAEHRLLTVTQIAALTDLGKPAVRNRLAKLGEAGLVVERTPASSKRRGRPERWMSLSINGISVLREVTGLSRSVRPDDVTADGIRCAEHLLAVNWFRISLMRSQLSIPRLSTRFLSSTSPFVERQSDGRSIVSDVAPEAGHNGQLVPFTPDGVFTLHDSESGKTLLFFLEVDMGTETLASSHPGTKDIRQKVVTYQQYFRSQRYKRYETLCDYTLNGFRVLFLASTPSRRTSLSKLVCATPPSNFIWLTDQDRMFNEGLAAHIWARGGRQEESRGSIVGPTMAHIAPLSHKPPTKAAPKSTKILP